ncbi:MAG: GspE/PulE family protein [Desulfitobacteriaceae bacterium]
MNKNSAKAVVEEFGQFLVRSGYIDAQALSEGLREQRAPGERIGEALVRLCLLTAEQLTDALSGYLSIPRVFLTQVKIDPAAVQLIPEDLALRHLLIPVRLSNGELELAMADPTNVRALEDVQLTTGYKIKPMLALDHDILAAIRQHLTVEKSLAQLSSQSARLGEEPGLWGLDSGEHLGHDGPTVRIVDSLLQQAIELGASDVHWEPGERELSVRFRLDGQLNLERRLPLSAARSVTARLKVMAGMDVAERRLPQDGRIVMPLQARNIDLRVSSLPTVYGEKVVVRILDSETARRSLNSLGMRPQIERELRSQLKRHHGLILVTGPTGSGKTTTLYALLRELNANVLNVVSVEDPVEYRLAGVNQVQVHARIGLTFAAGLRAILRQDPDVIMVGEIRDEETARIAIGAALTGHLVLSTLHTNTAGEAITRLIEMGIEPYFLASAISAVVAQRLVRKLCEHCKEEFVLEETEKKALGLRNEFDVLYRPGGCPQCRNTGFQGRIGVHELLLYNQDIKELVLAKHSSRALERAAVKAGMVILREDGLLKAAAGLTSLEEALALGVEEN